MSDALATVRPLRRLAELRTAGLIRTASEPADAVGTARLLPVARVVRPLLPAGGLRRGSVVAVCPPATSILFALLAEASATGSWCAVVGLPSLGVLAAAEAGIEVSRLALVPEPGPEWPAAVAALLDGCDIVVLAPPAPVAAVTSSRLAARARQRGGVLIPYTREWAGAELTLRVTGGAWYGLGQGRGRLRERQLAVRASGRGVAMRTRDVALGRAG